MHYIKSRFDIQKAAEARHLEAVLVSTLALQTLDPIMETYGIKEPSEITQRLLDAHAKGKLKADTDLKALVETLTRYDRAEAARKDFAFVFKHINDFGEGSRTKEPGPAAWEYLDLNEGEVNYYFEPYEAMGMGPNHYGGAKMVGHAHRLGHLMEDKQEMGMSTALRGL